MRMFTPVIIQKNTGLKYESLPIDKAIKFGEKHKNKRVIFITESNGITEQINIETLKNLAL